jgi:riboflavin kinase/FMN adenylyltransferase
LGHQKLISKVIGKGRAAGLSPLVVTFSEHPRGILYPEKKWLTLTSRPQKIAILEEMGISHIVCIDFSKSFAIIEGSVFLEALVNFGAMRYMAVGSDFHCGHENSYDAEKIAAFNLEHGVETEIVEPVLDGGQPVSSSRIRAALREGNTAEAERLLGREFVS